MGTTNLKDKVVVVTGSSSGIGKGAALYFGHQGSKIVLASRNTESNKALASEIRDSGSEAIFLSTDVSKSDEVHHLVEETVNRFGRIDIAINNAGIEGTPLAKTGEYEESVWDQVMDVNLTGVFLCMKYELPVMQSQGGGVIINIASMAGLKGGDAGVAYHASKFGVVGATKAAAFEYAKDNIRINAICPAVIETPMAVRAFSDPERRERAEKGHPIGRFGKVEEVVGTIAWLAADESAFITGTAIPVDGGVGI